MLEASRMTSTICVLDLQDDRRHVENGKGSPLCGADSYGAFVVENSADSDCVACRSIASGPGWLN